MSNKTYHVTWEIDVSAASPEDAAEQARQIQLMPESMATVFDVADGEGNSKRVDLMETEGLNYG